MVKNANTVAKRSSLDPATNKSPVAARGLTIDDTLTPQEELFVELYFQFNFNVRLAYERAGYSARSARVHAYSKFNQVHIQAAIARRRAVLRDNADLSRREKLGILAHIARDELTHPTNRIMAIALHSKLCGDDTGAERVPGIADEITPGSLRALTLDQLDERVNNGTIYR